MNRNNRSTRRASARRHTTNELEQTQVSLLKDLVRLQKPQMEFGMPSIPDVEEIQLRREKPHTFQVNWPTQTINTSTATDTTIAYSFSLSSLANASEFTALYDQYRLVQVVAQFYPDLDYSDSFPVYTVIDYDDATPLASAGQAQQYGTLQTTSTNTRFWQRTFNPQAALAAYSGAFTSFGAAPKSMWFDVASPSVQYYGLKIYIPQTISSARRVNVAVKTIWQFRNNR